MYISPLVLFSLRLGRPYLRADKACPHQADKLAGLYLPFKGKEGLQLVGIATKLNASTLSLRARRVWQSRMFSESLRKSKVTSLQWRFL